MKSTILQNKTNKLQKISKNYLQKISALVVLGITIISCGSPDPDPALVVPPPAAATPCTTLNQFVGIKMTSSGTNPEYNTFIFPGTTVAPINNIPVSPSGVFTYGGAYNPSTQEYTLVSNNTSTGNTLVKINASGVQTVTPLTGNFAEPVYLGGDLYFGKTETVSGVSTFKVLDKNLLVLQSIVVNNYIDWSTATTDNSRYIYYLNQPFLITYDKLNNTLVSTDLGTGSANLMGLEYKNASTLLACRLSSAGSDMISLNISNPTNVAISSVFNLASSDIRPESYSTVYNLCNNKYYISESWAGTGLVEVDLNTNTKTISSIGTNKIIGLALKN